MRPILYKANIVHSPRIGELESIQNGYIAVAGGKIEGVFSKLPNEYSNVPVCDYGDRLMIPSFSDMHLHAPQYPMVGMYMDLRLLEWLDNYTFPLEAGFCDTAYARKVYSRLAVELVRCGTTRVAMFSSIHKESTLILMEELEKAGITGCVGKVNMDRNCPSYLCESTRQSVEDTLDWIQKSGSYCLSPAITPRFTPSCSDELMRELGEIACENGLYIQSHLSENPDEIAWVKSLCPDCEYYYQSYKRYGLFNNKTLMAHCVFSNEKERAAMIQSGVCMVHCPDSNTNIASGIAPVSKMLKEGGRVALGSDIAGGACINMMDVLTCAIRVSKLRFVEKGDEPLTFAQAFYMATSAGAEFFGEGPGFKKGDGFHALLLDDKMLPGKEKLNPAQRLERICYTSRGRCVSACFSNGKKLFDDTNNR